MSKIVRLGGSRVPYPVTIVKLLKRPGDVIRKQEPLLQYSFKWMKEVGDHMRGDTWREEQSTIVDWDSPVEGDLVAWLVREGDVISQDRGCLNIKEPCSHGVQYEGLCAMCGRDMTEANWAAETLDTMRAPINMVHDQTNLKVSGAQAQRAETELQQRLMEQRKLTLVVDLDQTIIHACMDPTVGEWQRDPTNPNYEAVKDIQSFQLEDGPRGCVGGCSYWIKMRPGLADFLQNIKDRYELHVYTMGTRAYAVKIAELIDRDKKLFGNRVISRDENGSMTAKSLQRLFPMSTNMVVILDDRADVWPRNRRNLIKVTPYDFYKGIGDINSSFLPKREDLNLLPPAPDEKKDAKTNGAAKEAKVPALDDLVSMSGGEDETVTKRQMEEQEKTLEQQIKGRPLLHMQEELDKLDEAEKADPATQNGDDAPNPSPQPRPHMLLQDDDEELFYLEKHLVRLHEAYYKEFDAQKAASVAKANDLSSVPDVGDVLESVKSQTLQGTNILLSGIIPQGVDVRTSEMGLLLLSYGAHLSDTVNRTVTHLVASHATPRTQKVRQARKFPHIMVVNQDWLAECTRQWKKVDETPYLMPPHPADVPGEKDDNADTDALSEAGSEEAVAAQPRAMMGRPGDLRVNTFNNTGRAEDEDEDDDDDEEFDPSILPPEIEEGQMSPIDGLKTFNWSAADNELEEFLGSELGDDSEEDEEQLDDEEDQDAGSKPSKKRKHEEDGTESGDSATDETGSALAKKQRLVRARASSSLRTEFVAHAPDSSLPTPRVTGDEDDGNDDAVDFDEDELEKELLAEFERADGRDET